MSLKDVIIHIRIEEHNHNRDTKEKAQELSSKENVGEEIPEPKNNKFIKQNYMTKLNITNNV